MAQPNAPTEAGTKPHSVRFPDYQWEYLDRMAARINTDRAGVLRRLVSALQYDEEVAPTHTLATSKTVAKDGCLWCRVMSATDPVPSRTATLRQNQEPKE